MTARPLRIVSVLLALAAFLALAPAANASVTRTLRFSRVTLDGKQTVLGPGAARRLAGAVSQSGFSLVTGSDLDFLSSVYVLSNPPGCGTPVVSVSGDSFFVTWPSQCVNSGGSVVLRFTSADSITGCGSGVWTDNSNTVVSTAACASASDVVPAFDAPALAALIGLLSLSGLYWTRRRAAQAARS